MVRYEHAGGAAPTQLTVGISSSDVSVVVLDATGWPTGVTGPFWIVIGVGTANEEKILCASRSGNTLTVASGGRGADDTVAVPHNPPEIVRHVFTAQEADDANAHINATTNIHGIAGDLAGRTQAQTLTNKTMSGASNTFSAIPQSAITGLVDRLTVPHFRGSKQSPNTINAGVSGTPGTITTEYASAITTPDGYHSSNKQVSKAGLYLITYRLRLAVTNDADTVGDFRLLLGLNPPVSPITDLGTVIAQAQFRNHLQPGRKMHTRTSLSITISDGVTSEVYNGLSYGATLPLVPDYVGVNLYSGSSVASGWNIRTDNYTTSDFQLILDRHVATVGSLVCPIRLFCIYDSDPALPILGGSVEISDVFRLDEGDIIGFRVNNNSSIGQDVEIFGGAGVDSRYSVVSMSWLGP